MDAEKVALLRSFVRYFKFRPSVLHHPSLWFFRHYLNSLGAKIPPLRNLSEIVRDDPNAKEVVEADGV